MIKRLSVLVSLSLLPAACGGSSSSSDKQAPGAPPPSCEYTSPEAGLDTSGCPRPEDVWVGARCASPVPIASLVPVQGCAWEEGGGSDFFCCEASPSSGAAGGPDGPSSAGTGSSSSSGPGGAGGGGAAGEAQGGGVPAGDAGDAGEAGEAGLSPSVPGPAACVASAWQEGDGYPLGKQMTVCLPDGTSAVYACAVPASVDAVQPELRAGCGLNAPGDWLQRFCTDYYPCQQSWTQVSWSGPLLLWDQAHDWQYGDRALDGGKLWECVRPDCFGEEPQYESDGSYGAHWVQLPASDVGTPSSTAPGTAEGPCTVFVPGTFAAPPSLACDDPGHVAMTAVCSVPAGTDPEQFANGIPAVPGCGWGTAGGASTAAGVFCCYEPHQ